MYQYNATLVRIVDADTYDLEVDLGFSVKIKHRFRLKGIDCPETWRPKTESEREHGEAAIQFVTNEITGQQLMIKSSKLGIYGRYECDILYGMKDLATELRKAGFEKRESYE